MAKNFMEKYGNVAQESINFQKETRLFKELTLAFEELKQFKGEYDESPAAIRLSDIVKHNTGLSIDFSIDDYDPCVEIPAVNKNNILINSFIRNYISSADGLKMIKNSEDVVRGKVNIVTAQVSGVFADFRTKIHLPKKMFSTATYTPEEIAAITIHEIGHIFTYYEYIARTVTTNQVLAGLSKALDGSGTIEERESILINVKKSMNLTEMDEKELAKSNNKKVAEVVVVTAVTKKSESEIGANVCDFSTWEYLSDEFAARQGAGRHLVTALDKLYRGHWNISFRSTPAFIAWEAFKLLALLALPGIAIMFMAMDGAGDGTYDLPGARIKRVRNQIIEHLKDKDIDKDTHERLQADLLEMDAILAEINDRRQFVGVIWDAVSPSSRKARNQKILQQELEDIAMNDLFAKSAALRNAA